MMARWLIGLLLLTSNAFSQTMITKVIELNYLPAEKVIELIQPLVSDGEKISGSGQTLIVKVSPQTLTEIRDVLHKIDVPPVTFNITIYQGNPNWLNSQSDNDVTYSTQPHSQNPRSQSVQVMNGESALVSTGKEVPVVSAIGFGFYSGVAFQQQNIQTGILVLPVLQGSQVKLTVRRIREQNNSIGGQQFNNQHIDTTIMAPLNKWISLGSAEGTANSDPTTRTYSAGRSFSQNSTLYIKISIVHAGPGNNDQ